MPKRRVQDYTWGSQAWWAEIWASARPFERSTLALLAEQSISNVPIVPKDAFVFRWRLQYGDAAGTTYALAFACQYQFSTVTLDLGLGDVELWSIPTGAFNVLGLMRGDDDGRTADDTPLSKSSTIAGRDWFPYGA